MHIILVRSFRIVLVFLGIVSVSEAARAQAISITSVNATTVTSAAPLTRNGLTEFSLVNTYNVTYDGQERHLNSFVAGATTWAPLISTGSVKVQRNNASGANQSFPLLNPNQSVAFNRVNTSTSTGNVVTQNVAGVYHNTIPALFQANNLYTGTENLFVNSDVGNAGNPNAVTNIERLDFTFSTGFAAAANKGFAIFERGGNSTFRIAAITSVDGSGNATGFGSTVLRILPANYNNGGAGVGALGTGGPSTINYDVTRFATAAGPELDLMNNPNLGPQLIAGAFIPTSSLVTAGTTIFGYALFGDDVTATGNNLLNVDGTFGPGNTRYFPLNSGISNDMDLVSTGAVLYISIPEPSTWALLGITFVMGCNVYARRRTKVPSTEPDKEETTESDLAVAQG